MPPDAQRFRSILRFSNMLCGCVLLALAAAGSAGAASAKSGRIGDLIQMGAFSVRVNAWYAPSPRDVAMPSGKQLVVVDATIANQGRGLLPPGGTLWGATLRDARGSVYQLYTEYHIRNLLGIPFSAGMIGPGERLRLPFAFLVGAPMRGELTWILSTGGTAGSLSISLGATPSAVADLMPIKTPMSIHRVGETVDVGKLSLRVHGWGTMQGGGTWLNRAQPGYRFVWADIEFLNRGDTGISIDPFSLARLRDRLDRQFVEDTLHAIGGETPHAQLGSPSSAAGPKAGESVRHRLLFQVRNDSADLLLVLLPSDSMYAQTGAASGPIKQGEKIFVSLGSPPPVSSANASARPADVVKIGALESAVLGWDWIAQVSGKKQESLVFVDVLLVNRSDTASLEAPFSELKLRDTAGKVSSASTWVSVPELARASYATQIPPGGRLRQKVLFPADPASPGFTLVVDAKAVRGESVFGTAEIPLPGAPAELSLPPSLLGAPAGSHRPGEPIRVGGLLVSVLGWTMAPPVSGSPVPAELRIATVEVLAMNDGPAPVRFSDAVDLVDGTGQAYGFADTTFSIAGDLLPGERLRGRFPFRVPFDISDPAFIYQGWFGPGGERPTCTVVLGPEGARSPDPPGMQSRRLMINAMNQKVVLPELSITVTGGRFALKDKWGKNLPEGYRYLVVDATIGNPGSKACRITDINNVQLRDEKDNFFRPYSLALAGNEPPLPDEVPAEGSISGHVGFQVPADSKQYILVFTDSNSTGIYGAKPVEKAFVSVDVR